MQRLLSSCMLVWIYVSNRGQLSLTSIPDILVEFVSVWLWLIFLLLLQFSDLDNSKQLYKTASSVRESSCCLLFTSAVQPKWRVDENRHVTDKDRFGGHFRTCSTHINAGLTLGTDSRY